MRAMRFGVLAALCALAAPVAGRGQSDTGRAAHGQQQQPPPPGNRGGPPQRARLQRQIRQAFTRAVRTQVGLTDEQMQKLAPINQKFAMQRQALVREERQARMALRTELAKDQPDQAKVSQYTVQLQAIPHKRLDLNDAEDKDLGGVMTPVQLAKYRALQERVQRQLNAMRGGRDDVLGPPPDSAGRGRRGGGGGGGGGGGEP